MSVNHTDIIDQVIEEEIVSKGSGFKNDYTYLEKNLLRLSKNYLSYKEMRYSDEIVNTLKELYCLKEVDESLAGEEIAEMSTSLGERIKQRLVKLFMQSRGKERKYRGLDGKIYTESNFRSWQQGYPLLILLRKKIKEGTFDPDW